MKPAGAAAILVVLAWLSPASAQLMLPGAVHALPPGGALGTPRGAGDPVSSEAGQGKTKPVRLQPPSEATIVGRDLSRDGAMGAIMFRSKAAKDLTISNLSLVGEAISNPGAPCEVEVVAVNPIEAKFLDSSGGLARYEAPIAACSFAFEVLEGAVLVTRDPKPCAFEAADCRVDPTGLWGPRGDTIDARQIKQFEKARAQAEANMRTNFRALLASAGKDKDAVKRIAGEQAGFSSERSMACSAYAGEDLHGFCALRLTEARAIALQARQQAAGKAAAEPAASRGANRKAAAP